MIKRIKELDSKALIASEKFRQYVEKQETEINRGISALCVLSILIRTDKIWHGYKILKELRENTKDILVIEEGTLYPILRKLEDEGIVHSERELGGRKRKFYYMTEFGKKIYNYLTGFYLKLSEAILPLFEANAILNPEKFIFCPLCANKIEISNKTMRFCDVCGNNIEKELNERGIKYE